MSEYKQFTSTRILLSFWYTTILLIILAAFSLALIISYNNDVTRIVLKQDFGNHVPAKLSPFEERLVLAQVRELRTSSTINIIIIDLFTLIFGSLLSYFLAAKTLSPIAENMESQRMFIADASHELRSPISSIQVACEVVLRSSKKSNKEYKEVIEQVLEQSQRLGKLVNDLLSLSVLDAGKINSSFDRISLSEIAEKEIITMQPLFGKSKITIQKLINPKVLVEGDADKVRQLVIILLDNAIKYNHLKGTVTIKVENRPTPKLIVSDTGIGIAQNKLPLIFTRFYQAEESRSRTGSGLGLAIAKSIMKLHKGNIYVESNPGKGTTFTCVFPKIA